MEDIVKALKKLHKSMEAQNKILKRMEKNIRIATQLRDEEHIIDSDLACGSSCKCQREDTYEKYKGNETGRSFGI